MVEFAGLVLGVTDEDIEVNRSDVAFDSRPPQPLIEIGALRPRAEIDTVDAEREASLRRAVDQRRAHPAPARLRLDPDRGDPWRELRALGEIGGDHRRRAE